MSRGAGTGGVGLSARARVAVSSFSLFCVALLLTAYSAKNPRIGQLGSVVVGEVISPLHSTVQLVRDTWQGTWDRYLFLVGVEAENEDYRKQLDELRGDLARLNEFRSENERLKKLLNYSSENELAGVVGTVIGNDPSGWVRGIIIDKGASSGLRVGMPAVHARGVVGQVIAVSPNSARILLMTDHSSGIDAIIQGSRIRGIVEGSGSQMSQLRYVTREFTVRPDELVLTSGMDGIFPKGLLIGAVSEVQGAGGGMFQTVEVKPSVDFVRLEEVLILTTVTPDSDSSVFVPAARRIREGAQ